MPVGQGLENVLAVQHAVFVGVVQRISSGGHVGDGLVEGERTSILEFVVQAPIADEWHDKVWLAGTGDAGVVDADDVGMASEPFGRRLFSVEAAGDLCAPDAPQDLLVQSSELSLMTCLGNQIQQLALLPYVLDLSQ